MGFILFKEEEKYFQSSFEKAFVKKVKNSLKDFSFDILPSIAQKMKGLGFGLTPSGDDFNCGVLYALHYLKDISKLFCEVKNRFFPWLTKAKKSLLKGSLCPMAFLG